MPESPVGKAQQKAQHNENKVSTSWQETDFPNLGAELDSWKGNGEASSTAGGGHKEVEGRQFCCLPNQKLKQS